MKKKNGMTIEDLAGMIQRNFATKDDLKHFATKDDLKNLATKDDFQRSQVLMEAMEENVKIILEHTASLRDLPPKVDKIAEDLEAVKVDVDAMKVGQRIIQGDIKEIKAKLDQKADKKELKDLERRVLHAA